MFGTEESGYAPASWSPRLGAYQAVREINNKTDGVADWLLPNTEIRIAYSDSKCDPGVGIQGALHLTRDAFDGQGVHVIVGAGCSGASVTAALVSEGSRVPMISSSSSSPTLSNGRQYPYFLRTAPSDAFGAVAMVNLLRSLWNYTTVALVHSTDAYGSGIAGAFQRRSFEAGLEIRTTQNFVQDATDFSVQQRSLLRAGSRVIVLLCQQVDSSRFMRKALDVGIGGDGYLWLGGDTLAESGVWESDAELASDPSLRLKVLRGYYAIGPWSTSALYQSYFARRLRLPPTRGNDGSCSLERDDDGTLLWAQDHDGNASTPLLCAGHDLSVDNPYDAFAYDAAFAAAYAIHDLIEAQNRTEILGDELLEALIKRVRFEGVTGLVDFHDASSDPDLLYHGDRRVGISYHLFNYVDNAQGLVAVGAWTACSSGDDCSWSEQWEPAEGVRLTYSTADNTKPPQLAPPRLTSVRIGLLLPMFGTEESGYAPASWSPRLGAYQAVREINNKTDGVADWLLPNTEIRIAYSDSKCDPGVGIQGALHLTRDAFDGQGVHVIVGAGCSGASVTAALVSEGSRVPMISSSSSSPTLSNGRQYPYFLRTAPSDAFGAVAMVNLLRSLWNYTTVALVHSTDAYGSGIAGAFQRRSFEAGLEIRTTQNFVQDATDFSVQQRSLLRAGSRVIVLLCQQVDSSRFMRKALDVGIGGDGYLWLGGDTLAESGVWESDAELASDPSLRLKVLRGYYAIGPWSTSALYQSYFARRLRLPPTRGNDGSCSLERDDDGTLLWAQDHDGNASTPLLCAGHDLSVDNPYDAFAYDAAFAAAYAIHDLIEAQNRTEILGDELLEALIKRVRFEGVTGLVDFHDASSDPDLLYHGDRRVGISYHLFNYVDNAQGLVAVGAWTACSSGDDCSWSEQWEPAEGVRLTYSTADNRQPVSSKLNECPYGEVLDLLGRCVCDDDFEVDIDGLSCLPCDVGQASRRLTGNTSASTGCTLCAPGYYRTDSSLPASSCTSCGFIQGGVCDINTTIQTIYIKPGYWRMSGESLEILPCDTGTDSGTFASSCKGGYSSEDDGYCLEEFTGPSCALCVNRSQYFENGACINCPSISGNILLILGCLLAGSVCLFGMQVIGAWYAPRLRWNVIHRMHWYVASFAVIPKLKLVISFFQIVRLVPDVFELSLPDHYFTWMRFLSIFDLNIADLFLPTACIEGGYHGKLLLNSLGCMMIVLSIASVGTLVGVASHTILRKQSGRPWRDSFLNSLPFLLFVIIYLTPSTSNSIFAAWTCEAFQVNSLTSPPLFVRYLRSDLFIECDASNADYRRILILAYIFAGVWAIATPSALLMLLFSQRLAIKSGHSNRITRAAAVLHREYRTVCTLSARLTAGCALARF